MKKKRILKEGDIITIDVKYYKVDEGESTFLTSTQQKLKKLKKTS